MIIQWSDKRVFNTRLRGREWEQKEGRRRKMLDFLFSYRPEWKKVSKNQSRRISSQDISWLSWQLFKCNLWLRKSKWLGNLSCECLQTEKNSVEVTLTLRMKINFQQIQRKRFFFHSLLIFNKVLSISNLVNVTNLVRILQHRSKVLFAAVDFFQSFF